MSTATPSSPCAKTLDEAALLDAVRANAARLLSMNTATLLPLARLAVAPRVRRAPAGPGDACWAGLPEVGPFFCERLDEGWDERTGVQIACDEQALYVRFECRGRPAKPRFEKAYYHADSVELFLDAQHDHHHYFQFAITAGGVCAGGPRSRPLDSQRWERKQKQEDFPGDDAWRGQALVGEEGWTAQFTVPFALLGGAPEAGRPCGFNLLRARRDGVGAISYWNETHHQIHAPWGFGDLVLGEAPKLHVEQTDLGELHLWENRGALWLRNLSGAALDVCLNVEVKTGEREEKTFNRASFPAVLAAERARPQRLPFIFPFDPENYKWQHLHLRLDSASGAAGAAGAPLWRATYRFGRGQGWLLQIDDRREGPAVPNPDPGDPDFMAKKRRYIIRRLPCFRRKTTAQGAPSDFTLEAADGSVSFDLMRPGALQRIADYIYAHYENDVDRLLGATFFIHQSAVMTYANAPTGLAGSMNPLSIIRFGNAQCCCFAAALMGLLEKMKCEETGRPYRATRVGIPGHVTTVAEYRGKWVHLDPSVGRFYFLRDNRTLASMEELLADPELAGRAGRYLEAFHRKGASEPDTPTFYRPEQGIWPPGAPAE